MSDLDPSLLARITGDYARELFCEFGARDRVLRESGFTANPTAGLTNLIANEASVQQAVDRALTLAPRPRLGDVSDEDRELVTGALMDAIQFFCNVMAQVIRLEEGHPFESDE